MLKVIYVEEALLDLLKEYSLSVNDLLYAIASENVDVYSELAKRVRESSKEVSSYISSLPWKLAAILLFTIQSLYIVNTSGLYKGYRLHPPRESVVCDDRVCFSGLLQLVSHLKRLV